MRLVLSDHNIYEYIDTSTSFRLVTTLCFIIVQIYMGVGVGGYLIYIYLMTPPVLHHEVNWLLGGGGGGGGGGGYFTATTSLGAFPH